MIVGRAHVGQCSAEPSYFVIGQKACPDGLAVLPDRAAGVGVLNSITPGLGFVERRPQDADAAVGCTRAGTVRQCGEPFGYLGFGQAIDIGVGEGPVDMAAPVNCGGLDGRWLPRGRALRPVFPHEIIHARSAADSLSRRCRVMPNPGMGDHAARNHCCLVPGKHRGRTDRNGAHPTAHAGLDDIDVSPAGIMPDAEAVFDGEPCRGAGFALGFARQFRIDANLGQRLLDNLPEGEGGHAPSPMALARPPETRDAATAMVSSAR